MLDKLPSLAEYLRKIPAAFLVAIACALGIVLFASDKVAVTLAVDGFRNAYRVFLGPAFILVVAFLVARICMHVLRVLRSRKTSKLRLEMLHKLTPEEKGYLVQYIHHGANSIYVGMDDGVMGGLQAKGITYRAANMGSVLQGFAFNLQPWAREYLEGNPTLLHGHMGQPKTPREKLHDEW